MRFLHILTKPFGYFSTCIPLYHIVKFLKLHGHENILVSGLDVDKDDKIYVNQIKKGEKNFFRRIKLCFSALKNIKYDFLFVYDPADIMACTFSLPIIKKIKKIKVVCYHLELFVLDYQNPLKKRIGKLLEQIFISNSDFFVSLSPTRMKISEEIFRISCPKFVIPNSYDFATQDLRQKPHKKVKVLFAGGLEKDILEGIENYIKNGDFIFVFHGISKYGISEIKEKISKLKNVKIYERVLGYEDFKNFVLNHDIGFVWYNTERLNDKFAGWSASKYFRYLSCGKPVIVKNMPELKETTEENKFGVVIDSFAQIPRAVSEIRENYAEFVNSIKENYPKFEFSPNFKVFYEHLVNS